MKLTTKSSAPLYSYLPLTSNILLNTMLSQTHNLSSSLDVRHQISHPHKMAGTMSVLYISAYNMLNWMLASIAWTYPALFWQDHGPSQSFQDLTYLKLDLQQSGSGTSQTMWHAIQIAQHSTIRTADNPFSTVELYDEYRLPVKPEILNIC